MAKDKTYTVRAQGKGEIVPGRPALRIYTVAASSEDEAQRLVEGWEEDLCHARANAQARKSELSNGGKDLDPQRADVDRALHDLRSVQDEPFKVKSVEPAE
jgi:hypothetical protein